MHGSAENAIRKENVSVQKLKSERVLYLFYMCSQNTLCSLEIAAWPPRSGTCLGRTGGSSTAAPETHGIPPQFYCITPSRRLQGTFPGQQLFDGDSIGPHSDTSSSIILLILDKLTQRL